MHFFKWATFKTTLTVVLWTVMDHRKVVALDGLIVFCLFVFGLSGYPLDQSRVCACFIYALSYRKRNIANPAQRHLHSCDGENVFTVSVLTPEWLGKSCYQYLQLQHFLTHTLDKVQKEWPMFYESWAWTFQQTPASSEVCRGCVVDEQGTLS